MDLKSFREFMWNKRKNEHPRLKHTDRYQSYPEPWEAILKDVNGTPVSGLTERGSEPYNCRASQRFKPYLVKLRKRNGQFVTVRE